MNEQQKNIAKKVGTGVINALTTIIVIFALIMAISAIISSGEAYTNLFGYTFLKVESDSMKPVFEKDDVIKVKILSEEQTKQLSEGEVITFYDNINGKKALNTHRIISKIYDGNGAFIGYMTQGDNNGTPDTSVRIFSEIVGTYQGNGGAFFAWLTSTTGFMVLVVLPTVLVLIYCIVLVTMSALQYKKKKEDGSAAQKLDEIKEQAKREALEELKREQQEEAARQAALQEASAKQDAEMAEKPEDDQKA